MTMNAEAEFGPLVRKRREALDLTRKALAHHAGCSVAMIRKIETGERHPSRQIAELLAQALSIPDEARDAFIRAARGAEAPLPNGKTPSAPMTNLPAPLTSFVDRVSERAEVRRRLLQPDVRLLTLVGPPGIGKTRLGIHTGQTVLDHFADGVWFVPLAPISAPALVLPAIARLFDITEGASPLFERLQTHLRSRETLLIVDNFEHVLEAAPAVADLLKACGGVKVLATSRVPLRVYGEQEYRMPALSLPPQGARLSPQQLSEFDAIKLFVTRVQAFQPDFHLNRDNAQAVLDVCARMDGMPLAIELAASRLRRFTPHQLRVALQDAPLQTLAADARDAEPRQRTLRGAIQWSCDLLNRAQRAAFARLGVFVGGASTEAALAVCELADDAILHDLADQNLLKHEDSGEDTARWTMLEMIREFALDALAQSSGDEAAQTQRRHAEYFSRILKPDRDGSWRVMDVEQHNARAALRWLLHHKHPLTGELAQIIGLYFHNAGLANEGRLTLRELLSADIEFVPSVCYKLLSSSSICAWQQHDFEEGLHYAYDALAVARAMNSQPLIADALVMLSHIYIEMDDCTQAKAVALEALGIGNIIRHPESIVGALVHLAEAALILGEMSQAEVYYTEAYALCQAADWQQHVYAGLACKGMGETALNRRDYDHALPFLREGLEHTKAIAVKLWVLDVLAGVIGTMPRRMTADVQRAAKIWGAAEALNEKMGLVNAPCDRRRTDALIAEARTRIASKAFAAAWAEGRELSLDEAIALVMG